MTGWVEIAIAAASGAAKLLRENYLGNHRTISSSGKDIKTLADQEAQANIFEHLEPTGLKILAEESPGLTSLPNEPFWLVDPLDGTLNFSRGFPMAAVSIALWDGLSPMAGIIADVFSGDLFVGDVPAQHASLNGQSIVVSSTSQLQDAVIATGFPSGRSYDDKSLLAFVQKVQTYKKVRMLGSAALMLAQVAAGRFDIYEEEDIYIWDVAAGLALVSAAGGSFSIIPGSGPLKFNVQASNGDI